MANPIRVAIIGGGICGCSLANGLLQYPHIRFDVFESKSSLGERGAAVSLGQNACAALRSLGLDPEQALNNAGAVEIDAARCIIAVGEHKGKPIIELPGGSRGVSRTRLLDELLKSLPNDRLHVGKKLVSVSGGGDEPCTLTFEDETSNEADAVICCDGIHSTVRSLILTPEHANAIPPRFGGYWDARGATTPAKAAALFGTELFNPLQSTKIALTGNGAFMVFRPTDDKNSYTIIVSAKASPDYDETSWKQTLSREFLEKAYQDWEPNFRDAVIEALFADESAPGVVFSQWESTEAPIYCRGKLCMIGDAAHAMLPWMGVGAELAMEDAAVMSAILGAVSDSNNRDVGVALRAYELARHGRCELVMRRNHEAAKVITGQYGLDPAEISRLKPASWWADIYKLDLEDHISRAIASMDSLRVSAS